MEQIDNFKKRGVAGNWKRLAKEHTCIYAQPMDTDKNVVKAGDGGQVGGRGWVEKAKAGRRRDIFNSVNNKKTKIIKIQERYYSNRRGRLKTSLKQKTEVFLVLVSH